MSEKDNDFIQWLGIKGAIKDYKADRTLENRFKVIGYILKAMEVDLELKTPMTFKEFNGDESDTGEKVWGTFPTIQQIENFYEEQFVPLFTSEEELADAPEVSDDEDIMPKSYWQSNIDWLTERFPEGKYRDVVGLCKVATIGKVYDDKGKFVGYEDDSIGDQDFSLNPGRYVGVVIEDDGLTQDEFKQRMMAYYAALSKLNEEAHGLENKVMDNIQKLLG